MSEEVVSDVFVNMWTIRKRLPKIENIKYYLFSAVKNQSLRYLRRSIPTIQDISGVNDHYLTDNSHPESHILTDELAIQIENSVQKLAPKCKIIFRLIRDDGLKYKEVAQLLELSVKTVENQMTIAMKKIRKNLNPYFADPPPITSANP